jgi:DNA invertase Pin-like site-specific DNA recombinase
MTEHAIAIARVSAGKQAEEDQEPGLRSYAERQGYELDAVIRVHGRSAFHGRHVKHILAAVDEHVKNGNATVVIFRHVDRSSRQGVYEGFRLVNKIMDAGARIEFSEQDWLNDRPEFLGMMFKSAQEESNVKRDRKLQGNFKKRASGELVGRVPWGYDPVFRDSIIVNIKPNALGKEWIPRIFGAAVDGKSLNTISEMLKGIPSPQGNGRWDDATVRRVIASTTYYGHMTGNPNMKFDALVSVELWKQANLAVTTRLKRGRGTVKLEPTLAKPYCAACWGVQREGAPSGKSPMYRKMKSGHAYYVCTGHGPGRKSCGGPSIKVHALDAAVDHVMSFEASPHLVREYVAGDDNAERRATINEKIRTAQEAGDYLLVAQLAQQAMEIGPTVRKGSTELRESGQTIGQHWQTLTPAEKREELASWTVIAGLEAAKVAAVFTNPEAYNLGTTLLAGKHGNVLVLLAKQIPSSEGL